MQGRLVCASGLTQVQLAEIEQLAEACDRAEGLTMRLNWSTLARRRSDHVNDFLYYDGDRLVGYLGLFVFGDEAQQAEATAMTHPEYRRQGIFRRMLAEARAEVARRNIPSLLFFYQQNSPSGRPVTRAIGATYDHSEYKMIAQVNAAGREPIGSAVVLRPATDDEVPELARMEEEAFGVVGAEGWLREAMADQSQAIWAITHAGQIVGVIQGGVAEEENHLYGFCMKPEHRGKGYGKAALAQAMQQLLALRRQRIALEVEARNESALGLYRSSGFEVVTAYDYYRLPTMA